MSNEESKDPRNIDWEVLPMDFTKVPPKLQVPPDPTVCRKSQSIATYRVKDRWCVLGLRIEERLNDMFELVPSKVELVFTVDHRETDCIEFNFDLDTLFVEATDDPE